MISVGTGRKRWEQSDAAKCSAILDAERRTGRKVVVTFNMRFVPYIAQIKRLLKQGVIGDIWSARLDWSLDTAHGADYFRRWHRKLDNSGGLLVHKSTHHFDIVNWWLDDEPEEVFAFGGRALQTIPVSSVLGDHGGSDEHLRRAIFAGMSPMRCDSKQDLGPALCLL